MMSDRKFHILIVDDTPKNIQVVATILQNDEYSIAFVNNGQSAIEMTQRKEYDLVLLDVMMPDIDGFETCKELKKIEHNKNLPVIFLTAKTDEESILRGFEVGGVDYITKPFNSSELKARVKTHLELKHKTEELLKYQQNLEDRVQDGVEEIKTKNSMLIQQSKMAAMGEMINIIAHQWKQPLNSISLLNQNLLLSAKTNDMSDDLIENTTLRVTENLAFMAKTIDNFRNFFKPNKSKTKFYIYPCIKATLEILYAPLSKHSIEVNIHGDDARLFTYRSELQQVILNIVSNAKDALVQKGIKNPTVDITIDTISDDEYNILYIDDNATGIPEDIIDNIFEIYFTTKGDDGTGIGLYMVKMIMDDSIKGKIEVKNMEKGARFSIYIPKNSE
jgi:DNA-binding response OmpR family regulator